MKTRKIPDLQQAGTDDGERLLAVLEAVGPDEQKLRALIELMDMMLARPEREREKEHATLSGT